MLTVICEQPGTLRTEQRPLPQRGADEVLVRIKRVGVCGTDMHIYTGDHPYLNYPRVMGHELSGLVEEAPAGSTLKKDDVVYIVPYMSCGKCIACRQDKGNCCVNIQVLGVHRDGGMAEFLSVPQQFVHKAEGVTLDQAAMVEFLSIGAHAVRRAGVRKGQRVLVVGAGPIGIGAITFAQLAGGQVTALDSREDRLSFCREQLGVAATVQLGPDDEKTLAALTDGEFFDVVFDATGNIKAMERGLRFVAHAGTYVLISVVNTTLSFPDPEFHKRETTLLASRNATQQDFETVLDAMRAGKIPTAALNTNRLALADVPELFARLLDPDERVIKAIIEC